MKATPFTPIRKVSSLKAKTGQEEGKDTWIENLALEGVRANLLLEGKLGKSIERACSALALVPSAKLRRDKSNGFLSGIVGRMKWYEALVDIASVPGMRLGRSRAVIPGWHRSLSRGRRRCISGTGSIGQALRE
ncbi:hypothetical protein SASPL_155512 (mitochondrion) [Salvia splendens]|uniref:Uncharacterized protein n=1 Tax=Salvia splendens TaxID=180675 RepID=A0A8X8YW62_SALSN|nr:hypothetical protein SASPL_156289 [Salvia splendens]KAG6383897.1 hypothetical protein SASPL_156319 [Salvia splendens]KAG6383923.1 hypothetical protein SASPL_156352 [Salvia splendens]KAG6384639.1 hypothetical protein SASPL_155482 [Salvia splendens]KAG6384660.1 hypothetical protein SASPL_155512 [Salvia splendens]